MPSALSRTRLRERRSVRELIRPVEELARGSKHLFTAHIELPGPAGTRTLVPRFLFAGPGSGGASFLRIGVFGGIHGDEEASAIGGIAFLEHLHRNPEL